MAIVDSRFSKADYGNIISKVKT